LDTFQQLFYAELQALSSEAASKQDLSSLRGIVGTLHKDHVQLENQCKRAQSGQEAMLQGLQEEFQRSEAAAQRGLSSLKASVEALTGDHLKVVEEIKQVKRAKDVRIQDLDEKLNEAKASTKQTLNSMWEDVRSLRRDLDQALSQYKQVQLAQKATLQRLEDQSQKTEENALKLNRELAKTNHSRQDTGEALYHLEEVNLPTFIYSYTTLTDKLHRTNLATGKQSSHKVPSYRFKEGCCWSEVPGGSLLITGGQDGWNVAREVARIDVGTFEVSPQPPMLTPRKCHAAVYHTQHLYVLGGHNGRNLSECERYVFAENRWEALPPLPRACFFTSGVVVESSLYALGGWDRVKSLDLVQKLSLESLTWELMQFRLPFAGNCIPCFKLKDTEVFLVVRKTLCSFTGLEVRPLKTLTSRIRSFSGASYFSRGTLYCSSGSYEIGSLSN
jgi:hypothetical protein